MIDGSLLNNLRFVDGIVIISSNLCKLREMLHQMNDASKVIGLTMNIRPKQ